MNREDVERLIGRKEIETEALRLAAQQEIDRLTKEVQELKTKYEPDTT